VELNGLTAPAKTIVYLARHGTPDWNMKEIRYDVPPGPPLVEKGVREARQLGEFLRTAGVCTVYASPLVRAHRTAELAAGVAGLPVTVVDNVAEYRREENDDAVFERFVACFEDAADEAAASGPVVIVSHGGPVRVMLERLGVSSDHVWHYRRQFDHQNPLPPAGAWELARYGAGPWEARLVFSPQEFTEYLPAPAHV
jgi:broad specificity phosphatase PhoE